MGQPGRIESKEKKSAKRPLGEGGKEGFRLVPLRSLSQPPASPGEEASLDTSPHAVAAGLGKFRRLPPALASLPPPACPPRSAEGATSTERARGGRGERSERGAEKWGKRGGNDGGGRALCEVRDRQDKPSTKEMGRTMGRARERTKVSFEGK